MRLPIAPTLASAAVFVARQQTAPTEATAGVNNTIIPFEPAPLPQAHCTSPIYCPGPLLQAVQLSGLFNDSKEFVDRATLKPVEQVVAAFAALGDGSGRNVTYSELQTFVDENFAEVGGELVAADLGEEFVPDPKFLNNVTDEVVRLWITQVHSYWPLLARTTNTSALIDASPSTSTDDSPSPTASDATPTSTDSNIASTGSASVSGRALNDTAASLQASQQVAAETPQSNDSDALMMATSSFIPFKSPRTFVVPGQRFRELYYWDTYFVILGLLRSQLSSVALGMLENFADLVEQFGFIPNGNRLYYLNRSQPPMLTQMVDVYLNYTGDATILSRLLPLLEREWEWWNINRTIEITSPYSNRTYNVSHYDVDTSAPRPESYFVDWQTVELAGKEQGLQFTDEEKARLYADIASAAESGHDFSLQRWSRQPSFIGDLAEPVSDVSGTPTRRQDDSADTEATSTADTPTTATIPAAVSTSRALRYLNTAKQIPVDLNAILYKNEMALARFHNITYLPAQSGNSSSADAGNSTSPSPLAANATLVELWSSRAAARREAILDLHWNAELLSFADYNLTSSLRSTRWSASSLWPFWAGILPNEFTADNQTKEERGALLQSAFAGVRYLIDRYNGSLSTTLAATNQQWDFPNVWAPHTQIAIDALRALPQDLVRAGGVAKPAPNGTFELIPAASVREDNVTDAEPTRLTQLGVSSADQLPLQPLASNLNASSHSDEALIGQTSPDSGLQYVGVAPSNVGNASSDTELWTDTLIRSLANRFVASSLCSWYATGGQLNLSTQAGRDRWPPQPVPAGTSDTGTTAAASPGQMFEKYSQTSIAAAGAGGEYQVQVGFGWTNGVSIYLSAEYGDILQEPVCA
ncbi:glycoside hydrolase [Microstroma glucosiphilum]|uniref:Trehalase n=1 Tax=Pseudomicrostroma glucosiphilum TaxID=1684307 RepID=A0A316U1G2_9BASI|nr:glycoside hydrolase [Pseudomicrostroma glucosiphilum]PWN19219.1 glycoside hydrolase [Pseudomicrostroma glucosiphilum]